MKPAKTIHSGTGEDGTPDDVRGPEPHSSGVRNPEPLDPPTIGIEAPDPPGAQSANAASNGHWLHDEFGPRTYVAPLVGAEDEPHEDLVRQIAEALELQLGDLPEWADQAIHVRRLEGELRLVGFVSSDVIRRAAERCATGVTTEPVRNDLVVR
ncbi:MAG: BON domain-containing protein [Gemmobacter sp.]|nr:BON domain-containing protein [Gemmobacter sp.]